jgi:hypothetical protein
VLALRTSRRNGLRPSGAMVTWSAYCVQLLAPLAADRALEPAYFVVTRGTEERVPSLLLSTAARDPVSNCSLRGLIARSAR